MTQPLRRIFFFAALLGSSAGGWAQTFAGSDDFSGSDAKWSYFYRRADSLPENGLLRFTGSVLEFTKGPGAGSYLIGWDSDPASTSSRSALSATTNWVLDVVAANAATTSSGQFVSTRLRAAAFHARRRRTAAF
jgi:hypothetical protein